MLMLSIDSIRPWVFWPKTRKKSGEKIISRRKNLKKWKKSGVGESSNDIDISIENLLTENEKTTFRIKNLRIKLIKQAQCREIDTFYIN